jgi:hypothetical protein
MRDKGARRKKLASVCRSRQVGRGGRVGQWAAADPGRPAASKDTVGYATGSDFYVPRLPINPASR